MRRCTTPKKVWGQSYLSKIFCLTHDFALFHGHTQMPLKLKVKTFLSSLVSLDVNKAEIVDFVQIDFEDRKKAFTLNLSCFSVTDLDCSKLNNFLLLKQFIVSAQKFDFAQIFGVLGEELPQLKQLRFYVCGVKASKNYFNSLFDVSKMFFVIKTRICSKFSKIFTSKK